MAPPIRNFLDCRDGEIRAQQLKIAQKISATLVKSSRARHGVTGQGNDRNAAREPRRPLQFEFLVRRRHFQRPS